MLNKYAAAAMVMISGLCLARSDDDLGLSFGYSDDENAEVGSHLDDAVAYEDGNKDNHFVLFGGAGVPEYDHVDDPVVYDYNDYWFDDDDDDGYDGPGFHHVWWHHFYHHGEPHLPFPLFPPFFVHRRPLHHSCDHWPFVCRNTYEVIRWLQCYREFQAGLHVGHGPSVVPVVHAWKK